MAQKTIPVHWENKETLEEDETTIQGLKQIIFTDDPEFQQHIEQIQENSTKILIPDIEQKLKDDQKQMGMYMNDSVQEAVNDFVCSPDMIQILEIAQQHEYKPNLDPNLDNHNTDSISNQETCMYCTKYQLVSSAGEIEPGDTIRFKRWKGLYKHFATVISVSEVANDGLKAKVTLVELKKVGFPLKTKMKKNTKELDFSKNEIEKAIYTSMPYTREQIVQRAEEAVRRDEPAKLYDVAHNNCEQNSNQISQSKKISTQADTFFRTIKSFLAWFLKSLCKLGSFILKKASVVKVLSPVAVIGAIALLYEEIRQLKHLLKQGIICLGCHDEKLTQLKVSLVFSIVGLALSALTGFHVATVITTGILGFVLPFLVPFVYKKLASALQPSYNIPKTIVKDSKMVLKGDVITFPYCFLSHEGIVTEIKNSKCSQSMVKLTVVHFPYPGLFGQYTVEKEEIYFDLKKDKVYVYDFSNKSCLSNDEVVKKALEECGKTNHGCVNYRSSHMSRLCKTGAATIETLPYKRANTIDDLSPGDVIDFSYFLLSHEAVVVKVDYAEKMVCSVVHYNYPGLFNLEKRKVVEEQFEFDLSNGDVFVHRYKAENVYKPDEVVNRARSRLGECNFNTFTNRSSHLAQWCKERK